MHVQLSSGAIDVLILSRVFIHTSAMNEIQGQDSE